MDGGMSANRHSIIMAGGIVATGDSPCRPCIIKACNMPMSHRTITVAAGNSRQRREFCFA
jgi:hypothetical protein